MGKILIQESKLRGRYPSMADAYADPPNMPDMYELEEGYTRILEYLTNNGEPVVLEQIDHLPFIEDGVISAAKAISVYRLNNVLVSNAFRPYFGGIVHLLKGAARLDDRVDLEDTMGMLKRRIGWRWDDYWVDEKEVILDVLDSLKGVEDVRRLLPPDSFQS